MDRPGRQWKDGANLSSANAISAEMKSDNWKKMFFQHKIETVLVFALLLIGVSVLPSVAAGSTEGTLLRGFDVPQHFSHCCNPAGAVYWPIGVAFSGQNLWYSQPGVASPEDIFLTTTSGVLLKTLSSINSAGAIAWDGSNLWVGIFSISSCSSSVSGCGLVFQVNPTTGAVVKTLDLTSIFAADNMGLCNFIDGLSFDPATGTLWVSPDIGCATLFTNNPCSIGFAYNVDTSGKLLHRIQFPFGVAGVAKVGNSLYTATCGFARGPRTIVKTTLEGEVLSSFPTVSVSGNHESAEGLGFDPTTFAPNCALWAVQDYGDNFDASLAAYQVAC